MSRAIATQTFHYNGGTVFGGAAFDSSDPVVKDFAAFFSIEAEEEKEQGDTYEEQPLSVLRSLAQQRRLDAKGGKSEIIERLRRDDAR